MDKKTGTHRSLSNLSKIQQLMSEPNRDTKEFDLRPYTMPHHTMTCGWSLDSTAGMGASFFTERRAAAFCLRDRVQRAGQNSCRWLIQRSAQQMGPGPQERAPTPQVLHRQEGRVIQGRLIPGWLTLPLMSPWPGFRTPHWSCLPQAQLNFFIPKHAHTLPWHRSQHHSTFIKLLRPGTSLDRKSVV